MGVDKPIRKQVESYTVVWSGRDPLLPDREEKMDNRFAVLPSYDFDDNERAKRKRTPRKYNKPKKKKEMNNEPA